MDAVPRKFVDSTVELFSRNTLDRLAWEVRHPQWEPIVNLHYRNRVCYEVEFYHAEGGIKYRLWKINGGADRSASLQSLRKNRRFARIGKISDQKRQYLGVAPLGEAPTAKLLESIVPFIDQFSGIFDSFLGSSDFSRLTSIFRRAYFRDISLFYCGQIAYDFLEEQINNSPFLSDVQVLGPEWPKSSLDLMKKFCLKGRPGKHVRAHMAGSNLLVDSSYIDHFFLLWNTSGNVNFSLTFIQYGTFELPTRIPTRTHMSLELQTVMCSDSFGNFFKHKTKKSVTRISNDTSLMECYICECSRFEKCLLKERYPKVHNF
uniref:F-box protein n=1 Tax=Steinernema glaseri TaxID=37863 RepID=A0A1I7Z1F5_9BILA